uniref:Uncharacterized protein n=1 Tax=Sulfolobus islandicus rod-shaped virus 1 TaxID=157898 RepID=Q5W361_SIRV1|nr:hypothetical protein [Sulfolobus islandicus rod-shaped virus 1]
MTNIIMVKNRMVNTVVRKEVTKLYYDIKRFFNDPNAKKLILKYDKPIIVRKSAFFSWIAGTCIYEHENTYYYEDDFGQYVEMKLDYEERKKEDVIEISKIILSRLSK